MAIYASLLAGMQRINEIDTTLQATMTELDTIRTAPKLTNDTEEKRTLTKIGELTGKVAQLSEQKAQALEGLSNTLSLVIKEPLQQSICALKAGNQQKAREIITTLKKRLGPPPPPSLCKKIQPIVILALASLGLYAINRLL